MPDSWDNQGKDCLPLEEQSRGAHANNAANSPTGEPAGGSLRKNNYSVRRSTNRVAAKYRRHEVEQLEPSSTTSETTREQYHRQTHNDYQELSKRKTFRIRTLIAVVVVAVVLLVAGTAARTVFVASFEADLKGGMESQLYDQLATQERAENDSVAYTLLVGLDDGGIDQEYVADVIALLRTDTQQQTAGIILIPNNARAYIHGQGYVALGDVRAYGGQELLYATVKEMLGVQIDHYAEADLDQFNQVVDLLGGVEIVVPPNTNYGGVSVEEGAHLITSQEASVLSRCWQTYSSGLEQRNHNNVALLVAILGALDQAPFFKNPSLMNVLGDCVATDISYAEYVSLKRVLAASDMQGGVLPHTIGTLSGVSYSFVDADTMLAFMERVDKEGPQVLGEEEVDAAVAFDPALWAITVRNGSGISGTATQAAQRLQEASFVVEDTGNANQFVYDETLVVYNQDSDVTAANNVIAALGCGRAVQNPGSYEFNGDILVVVGKDWVP